MRGPGCCACAMGKGDHVHLKRQSPEQKVVLASDVGVVEAEVGKVGSAVGAMEAQRAAARDQMLSA